MSFNPDQYLKRINFKGTLTNNYECLKAIHRAQHRSIAFENFDICLGRGIDLSPDALMEKLVMNKRGGYCFEVNGLLLMALKEFGFEARALLGRVHVNGRVTGRSHQVSLVNIDGKQWVVDTGFGAKTPPGPVPLICNEPISFGISTYRLMKSQLYGYMLQIKNDVEWKDLYSFDLSHVCEGDIDYGNHYTSTSPNSNFTTARIAALPLENGIVTLRNFDFKKVINGEEEIKILADDGSYLDVLKEEFGIELGVGYGKLKGL